MYNVFMVNTMRAMCEQSKTVPVNVQSNGANEVIEIDLSQLVTQGKIELVQGVFIDNVDGEQFDLECDVTGQRVRVLKGTQMCLQLLCTQTAKFLLTFGGAGITRLQFVNFPVLTQLY